MEHRTLLVHWDEGPGTQAAADSAAALVRAGGGHLILLALGLEPGVAAYGFGTPGAAAIAVQADSAREEAEALRGAASAWLAAADVPGEVRALTCPADCLGATMAEQARRSDLVVCAPPHASAREDAAMRLLEGALFEGSTPVLVCPSVIAAPPAQAIVAWDGGAEALAALRASLGLLKRAEAVELLMIDPDPGLSSESEPGAETAVMLARHGVKVSLAHVPSAGHTVGEALCRRVAESGAGLLVMGAYGHSRLREALIGGPTRDILRRVPCPVLMAH